MQPTNYAHVNDFLVDLLARMQSVLGEKLVGLYLYGSLVTSDYDDTVSDIDLLAVVAADVDMATFEALNTMQNGLLAQYPQWQDRLEIAYLSALALKTFKTQNSPIAVISPGEPFNIKEAGIDWLINWYVVREKGVTLFGPPPAVVIESIASTEYVAAVKAHMMAWREWINADWIGSRPSQAYAILTVCRGLYTIQYGEQPSKIRAAAWAEKELPQWASLIQNAVLWRQAWRENEVDHAATLPETRRFVHFVIDRIEGM